MKKKRIILLILAVLALLLLLNWVFLLFMSAGLIGTRLSIFAGLFLLLSLWGLSQSAPALLQEQPAEKALRYARRFRAWHILLPAILFTFTGSLGSYITLTEHHVHQSRPNTPHPLFVYALVTGLILGAYAILAGRYLYRIQFTPD